MYEIGHIYIDLKEITYLHVDRNDSHNDYKIWFHFKNGRSVDTRCSKKERDDLLSIIKQN